MAVQEDPAAAVLVRMLSAVLDVEVFGSTMLALAEEAKSVGPVEPVFTEQDAMEQAIAIEKEAQGIWKAASEDDTTAGSPKLPN